MFNMYKSLETSQVISDNIRYSLMSPELECGTTTFYITASLWSVLIFLAVAWLLYSNRLYSSFADPVLVSSRTGISALTTTYSCSLVILIRILSELRGSMFIASKDMLGGIAVILFTMSLIQQTVSPSYLDSNLGRVVQRNTAVLVGLSFLITQTTDSPLKVIGSRFMPVVSSLVLFSLTDRIFLNISKRLSLKSAAYSDTSFMKAAFKIIQTAEDQYSTLKISEASKPDSQGNSQTDVDIDLELAI